MILYWFIAGTFYSLFFFFCLPSQFPLIHSIFSAGIGRTGTFLAVHTNLDRELKGETIDIKETVARLRRQRIGTNSTILLHSLEASSY